MAQEEIINELEEFKLIDCMKDNLFDNSAVIQALKLFRNDLKEKCRAKNNISPNLKEIDEILERRFGRELLK